MTNSGEFKQVKPLNVELGSKSFSCTENMLTRTTTEFNKSVAVSETVEYSSKLEAFIRQIVREEIERVIDSDAKREEIKKALQDFSESVYRAVRGDGRQ